MSNSEKKQANSHLQQESLVLKQQQQQEEENLSLSEESSNAKPTTAPKDITTNTSFEEKSSTSKKSKKKKKSKAAISNNMNNNATKDEIAEMVERILSPSEPTTSNVSGSSNTTPQTCPVKNCKQRLTFTSITCQFCNKRYCLTHRLPESHSEKCAEKTRQSAHSSFKSDSIRLITEERRKPGIINTKGFSAERSKEELRKRYKEKMEHTKQQERGGGKSKG
ncbi:10668_t:CDS:2 [Ambispora gerdemannii]|uniref:10668_t:CDS:1 n=1 Tax=Ambispora gerdemannii TaxID=144530 RepID=A0A9N8V423_9GLOM|nr:10668_t:CDS:2 [Ambispora gerdemannii]